MTGDNNPKSRTGALKPPLEYIPTVAEAYIALVLEGGAAKYGPFNWRDEAISISTYVGAIRRHIGAIADGEDVDPESGQPHWAHIAASCCIALDAQALGKLINDRPARGSAPEIMAAIAAQRAARPRPPGSFPTGTHAVSFAEARRQAHLEREAERDEP